MTGQQPIVPVVKKDQSLRLCGDYKVSVNQALETDTYPLPRLEELLATLSRGKIFSKIDLAAAYQQVFLDDDSKKYTTINTHIGLFVYNRLPFGISSAPSIFQLIMENLMKDLPVVVFLDDLLIMGRSEEDHLHNLQRVLQSTVLAPLYGLLWGDVVWKWTEAEQSAFVRCKDLLTSDQVLAHYDPSLPLTLACDASAYGIGAVIQHTMPIGEERPIAYASCTLSSAEEKYSQIDK